MLCPPTCAVKQTEVSDSYLVLYHSWKVIPVFAFGCPDLLEVFMFLLKGCQKNVSLEGPWRA